MDAIIASNLNKIVKGKKLLSDVSFTIPKGTISIFIGSSGAGKTTTIKSLLNLYTLDSGKIEICGFDSKDQQLHFKIGYVPEKENFPKMSAWNFLIQMSEFFDLSRKEIEAKILHYAEIFGLKGKLDISLPNMSSGQRKRIMIIQALINDPDVLIMDEPTENLDPDNRETFYKVLDELKAKGTTMLISTHNLIELEEHCDHVIIIAKGEIKYQGLVEKRHGALREVFNEYREKEEMWNGDVLYKKPEPDSIQVVGLPDSAEIDE